MKRKPRSKAYTAWANIKKRCYDKNNPSYVNYGARGIKLADYWLEDSKSFCQYVENLDGFAADMTLDRKDNDGDYCIGNLRWTNRKVQVENRRQVSESGLTGVGFYVVRSDTYAIAFWRVDGRCRSKSFNVKKFGLLPAFKMARAHRLQELENLNSSGSEYPINHTS